jgi:acetoin:2,6-dichlorophenolindophenol oxidoreductase subunit alpha
MKEKEILHLLGDKKLLEMYWKMVAIRGLENTLKDLFLEGKMPGTIHQYVGMEACAVGVCAAMREGDVLASTHRPNGHAVAMGLSLRSILSELYGREDGCCRGKGGSMHVGNMKKGMLPANAIVGANIPIVVGVALSFKMRKESRVAVSAFGDGASNEGAFHEGLNMAAVYNVPAVFVCENNQYGASTSIKRTLKIENIADRAAAYGMPGAIADGMDVLDVFSHALEAIDRARRSEGPTLLELKTFRYCGHSRSDSNTYMSKEEKDHWKAKDAILHLRNVLLSSGVGTEARIREIEASVESELADAVAHAQQAPNPSVDEIYEDLYVTMETPR